MRVRRREPVLLLLGQGVMLEEQAFGFGRAGFAVHRDFPCCRVAAVDDADGVLDLSSRDRLVDAPAMMRFVVPEKVVARRDAARSPTEPLENWEMNCMNWTSAQPAGN